MSTMAFLPFLCCFVLFKWQHKQPVLSGWFSGCAGKQLIHECKSLALFFPENVYFCRSVSGSGSGGSFPVLVMVPRSPVGYQRF